MDQPSSANAQQVAAILRLLNTGAPHVLVHGRFMSGVKTSLAALANALSESGYGHLTFEGVDGLSSVSFGTLTAAGLALSKESRAAAIVPDFVDQVRSKLGAHGVVMVLAPENVDDISWGVLQSAVARHGFQVVLGTTDKTLRARVPETSMYVELGPLPYDEIHERVQTRLGGGISEAAMSEVFALSGGFAELALAVIDANRAENRLQYVHDQWQSQAPLWTPLLTEVVESMLARLSVAAREALALLANAPILDRNKFQIGLDREVHEELHDAGLLSERVVNGEPALLITPPLIAEYFRHELTRSQRERLSEAYSPLLAIQVTSGREPSAPDVDVDAVSVRVVHEIVRTRIAVAREAFDRAASVENALNYLRLLMSTSGAWEDIAQVLRSADLAGTDENTARLIGLSAYAHAFVHNRTDEAISILHKASAAFPSRLRTAFAVAEAEIELRSGNLDVAARLVSDVPEDTEDWVRAPLLEMRSYIHAGRADFSAARASLDELDTLPHEFRTSRGVLAETLTLIGEGRVRDAERRARAGYRTANTESDPIGLWRSAYAVGAVQLVQGRFDGSVALLNSIIALGSAPPQCAPEACAILTAAEVVSDRVGERLAPAVRERAAQLRARVQGLFPGMSAAWVDAYRAGEAVVDQSVLWESAIETFDRGGRLSALITMTTAIGHRPEQARLQTLMQSYAPGSSPFVDASLAYADAMVSEDAPTALAAGVLLSRAGRYGLAYDLLRDAARWAERADDERTSASCRQASLDVEEAAGFNFGLMRARERALSLTQREIEVARLAAASATNTQIAKQLGISTRTAETHAYRVMRKLDANSREDIAEMLAASGLLAPQAALQSR